MNNLDEDQTALKVLAMDTYDNLITTSPDNTIVDNLNLKKVRMAPPHFCL